MSGIFVLVVAAQVAAATGFEQVHRLNSLTMQHGTDSFATNNQFGNAFAGSLLRQQIQLSIDSDVSDGSVSLLLTFPNLVDLAGSNQASLLIGGMNGTPVLSSNNPAIYDGASDLDWWYTPDPNDVDAAGNALQAMFASIVSGVLNGGPGRLTFGNSPVGGGTPLSMSSMFIRASIGPSSAPLNSPNNLPPGRRPGENIDPALTSFATMNQGQMRGNISAAALASSPIPAELLASLPCSQGYTATNTMLDLLISGCTVFFTTQIRPTQPDQSDPDAPVAGAGAPYTFTVGTGRRVTGCRDRLNNTVDLQAGLAAAAYSAYFTFTTDRVIALTPPEIVLALPPASTNITNGSAQSFGSVNVGTNADLTFTIVNTGLADLANVAVTIDGADAALFVVVTNPTSVVSGANGVAVFTVRFTPGSSGSKNATLRISSSDADENPFNLLLEGTGVGAGMPALASVSMLENGAFRFLFTNSPGASFTVLSATNIEQPLADWTVLGSATQAQAGLFEFIDPSATNFPRRFYRVRNP